MIEIPESTATLGLAVPVFFERTERIRERIVDCTKEELVDIAFYYLGVLEEVQGASEKLNDRLETILGYQESMFVVNHNEHPNGKG